MRKVSSEVFSPVQEASGVGERFQLGRGTEEVLLGFKVGGEAGKHGPASQWPQLRGRVINETLSERSHEMR